MTRLATRPNYCKYFCAKITPPCFAPRDFRPEMGSTKFRRCPNKAPRVQQWNERTVSTTFNRSLPRVNLEYLAVIGEIERLEKKLFELFPLFLLLVSLVYSWFIRGMNE